MRLTRAFVSLTLLITIFATLVEIRGGEVSPRENPLQEILGAWDKRRHELNSVEWRFRGSTRWSRNPGAKSPDDTDMVEGKLEVVARFNFAENRLRREVEWDSYFGDSYGVEHQHTIAAVSGGRLTTRILPGRRT